MPPPESGPHYHSLSTMAMVLPLLLAAVVSGPDRDDRRTVTGRLCRRTLQTLPSGPW